MEKVLRQLTDNGIVLLTITIQTGVLIWWAATLTARVSVIEREVDRCRERIYSIAVGELPRTPNTETRD